jgi:hypothetical protein
MRILSQLKKAIGKQQISRAILTIQKCLKIRGKIKGFNF